ncbi:hemicentin-1-like [Mytilus edulis]|uniref:hemicentin-1-like n=1 Tax=Mytilus edulis TaxID=6550 RepID=UPI0039F0FE63
MYHASKPQHKEALSGVRTETEGLLTVTIEQPSYSVNPGSTVTLQCLVNSTVTIRSVYWELHLGSARSKIKFSTDPNRYSGSTTTIPSLTIISATHRDVGYYFCFASNDYRTVHSSSTILSIAGSIPTVSILHPSYSVTPGNTVTLQCLINSTLPVRHVYWERYINGDKKVITFTTDTSIYTGSTATAPSLTIFNAVQSDVGYYKCFAYNGVGTGRSASTVMSLNGSVPTVSVLQSSYSVTPGDTVILQCLINSTLHVTYVYWERYIGGIKKIISFTTDTNKYSGSTSTTPSLTILHASQSDAGNYKCFANNGIGKGYSTTTILSIAGSLPTVTVPQSSYSVPLGNTVTLQCLVNSTLTVTSVYWKRYRGKYSIAYIKFTTDANKYRGTTTTIPSLTIFNTEQSDVGTYTCFAYNGVGIGQSTNTILSITGSVPAVSIQKLSYSVTPGDTVVLQCLVISTLTLKSVYWQRNIGGGIKRITFETDNNKYSGSDIITPSLTLFNSAQSDVGIYTCYAINGVGTGHSTTTTLTVTGSLLTVDISPSNADLLEGQSQLITCTITGEPAVRSIIWYFTPTGSTKQQILSTENTAKYYGGNAQNPSVLIMNFQSFDGGTYFCSAINVVGQSNSTYTVLRFISDLHITASLTTYSTIVGDSIVTMLCQINGTPPAVEWDWTKTPMKGGNAQVITMGTGNAKRQVVKSATNPNLNIFSITEDDEGIYKCRANNGKQQYMSGPVILKVLEASSRSAPGEPEIGKPIEFQEGINIILTCNSAGGNPSPSVVWFKDDILILSGTTTFTSGNITTTTLTLTTTTDDDHEVYECQADNGFLQGPLVKTAYLAVNPSNNLPSQPQIVGVQRYDLGDIVTLSCSSTGGNPLPSVNWLRNDNIIANGIRRSAGGGVTTTTLTFNARLEDHLGVLECQADNGILQKPLSSTTYIELYFSSNIPILTGPTKLTSGSAGKWTCSAMNGYPAPTISMRIEDQSYTQELTIVHTYDVTDKSYTVAGSLNLVPSSEKSGQTICCDVSNLFNNKLPQSVCLQLTIIDKEEQNVLMYVVLGLIGGLLLFVLIIGIICYRNGFTLFRGKKRKNVK